MLVAEHVVPLVHGDLFQRGRLEDAGVVDENVEPAELLDYRGDGFANALGIVEVGAHGEGIDVECGELAHRLFRLGLRTEDR